MLEICFDNCKSQEMCDRTLDACLSSLKFLPDWFVTNKMLKDFDNTVFLKDEIAIVIEDSDSVTFFSYIMDLVNLDLHNFSLDDDNFNNDDSETIIHVRLPAWCNKQKQWKTCKKVTSKKLMPLAWHPRR